MITEFIIYSTLAMWFWFFQKITDWHHEHWLDFFYWAKYVSGILAWICSFACIYYSNNPVIIGTYASLLFYWFWLQKVDNDWHMITAFFMLFAILLSRAIFPFYDVIYLFFAYIIFNYIRKNLNLNIFQIIFKYKLHFLIIPIIYSIYKYNIYWFSIVFFNLFGTFIANRIFNLKKYI